MMFQEFLDGYGEMSEQELDIADKAYLAGCEHGREQSKAVAVAKPKKAAKRFVKPTKHEIAEYFVDCGSVACNDDADSFYDFYEYQKEWKVGKTKMKCWKTAVRGWHKRNKESEKRAQAWAPEQAGMLGAGGVDDLRGMEPLTGPADEGMALLLQASRARLEHQA